MYFLIIYLKIIIFEKKKKKRKRKAAHSFGLPFLKWEELSLGIWEQSRVRT